LAVMEKDGEEMMVGMGQYHIDETTHTAEAAFAVRDDYQGQGIATELLAYLTYLAKKEGLYGFTAEVLMENKPMLKVFEKMGFVIERIAEAGVYELNMSFKES